MRLNKFKREIQKWLEKYGDIPVLNKIDYWYRETYEGAIDWKVRETVMLSDYLNIENLDGIEPYEILKALEHPSGKLPFKVSVEYADSKERYEQQNAEHPEEEKRKKETLQNMLNYYRTYLNGASSQFYM
jgi:hypothetical protein